MEPLTEKLSALFDCAGYKLETLTYEAGRINPNCRRAEINGMEADLIIDLLTAIAPFKERLLKLKQNDL